MAPEVVKNIEINEHSDIWSLGCIVIEMITGKIPWSNLGSNQLEIFKIISNGVYPPLPTGISQYCQDFL
jgi:serine/threonine protein kinase